MKLGVEFNFEDTYEIESISTDFKKFQFYTIDKDDKQVLLEVNIEKNHNRFLPQVYNLGFGPLKEDGTINDTICIKHKNNSKVYSTILLGAITFLNENEGSFIGIDGSDMLRAYLYYKLSQTNYDYLAQFIDMIGVKYYIRLLRGKNNGDPFIPDHNDLATQPFRVIKGKTISCDKLYNYFIFKLIEKK